MPNSDRIENSINDISNILIELEFRGLTPLECLLKIIKENKQAREHNKENENA